MNITRRSFLVVPALAGLTFTKLTHSGNDSSCGFVCPPCGCSMDKHVFEKPGLCSDCGMVLKPKHETSLGIAPTTLPMGAGEFRLDRFSPHPITVNYYLPNSFDENSQIVLIIPGAGRNGDDYRNMWLEPAIAKGAFIAALSYPEAHYDFAAYNMGGLIRNLTWTNPKISKEGNARVIRLNDSDIQFQTNTHAETWMFGQFDQVFEFIRSRLNTKAKHYSLFGHSAGAQIIHRMALAHPNSKAKTMIAANAGFYTFPQLDADLPFGMRGLGLEEQDLAAAYAQPLVLMLAENDNSPSAGGTFLRTPSADQQGLGRLQRGTAFFNHARQHARKLAVPFNWQLKRVPKVGHHGYKMSQAAAQSIL